MTDQDLKNLEQKIDALISSVAELKSENSDLRDQQGKLTSEHERLLEKTHAARDRIETMITRLKTLERS
jgi:cell division protein ZapB